MRCRFHLNEEQCFIYLYIYLPASNIWTSDGEIIIINNIKNKKKTHIYIKQSEKTLLNQWNFEIK